MNLDSLPLLSSPGAETITPLAGVAGSSETSSISALLAVFRSHSHFVVTSHSRPDGDAIGSSLAMAEILDQLGCTCDVFLSGTAPAIYKALPNLDRIRFTEFVKPTRDNVLSPAILLECDSIERTGLRGLEGRRLINIDHHASGRNFGAINWIDPGACAVAAMVYRIAIAAGVTITRSMATCLYTSILSDTGAFTYPNTTPESFAIAHELTQRGVQPSRIARDLYFTNPLSKVRLLSTSLSALKISGNLAWSWVTLEDLERAEATPEDCEGIVGNLIAIDGIDAAFFLREQADGQFRLSLRSKGNFDVARIAEVFHGGGHINASGCTMPGPLEVAIDRVLAEMRGTKARTPNRNPGDGGQNPSGSDGSGNGSGSGGNSGRGNPQRGNSGSGNSGHRSPERSDSNHNDLRSGDQNGANRDGRSAHSEDNHHIIANGYQNPGNGGHNNGGHGSGNGNRFPNGSSTLVALIGFAVLCALFAFRRGIAL